MATLRRVTEAAIKAKMAPYVAALGRVAHSWNRLQEDLGQLFGTVTGLLDGSGMAIWHSTPNDRTQREMLRAAVQASARSRLTTARPKAKADIKWLLDRADAIADQRNTAIHAPMTVAIGHSEISLFPITFHGNPRAKKLVGKDILAEFGWYESSTDTLTIFARNVRAAITSDGAPWPNRPQMPALQPNMSKQPRRKSDRK
jgi:hypothetical protein